jgi:folate-dependent phosphoribosylglycinamide formyltransferase PurN
MLFLREKFFFLRQYEEAVMSRNLVIFASGGKGEEGGTGAANLARKLPENVLAFVSPYVDGSVMKRALSLSVPCIHFPGPYTESGYENLIQNICAETGVRENELWYALSGWFKKVYALSFARTFNIHPAPLPRFAGIYGEALHQAVWRAWEKGQISHGEILGHFVTEEYDVGGPVFFRWRFPLCEFGGYEDYRQNVRLLEHAFQPFFTRMVIEGEISWDGLDIRSLRVPPHYVYL